PSTSGSSLNARTAANTSAWLADSGRCWWGADHPSSRAFSIFMPTYRALAPSSPTRIVPSPGVCPFSMSFSLRGTRSSNTAPATGPPGIILAAMCSSPGDGLVEEVSFAGEHHREAELVGAFDVRFVAHRAAGLHDHRDAGGRGRLDAVGERVERVRR